MEPMKVAGIIPSRSVPYRPDSTTLKVCLLLTPYHNYSVAATGFEYTGFVITAKVPKATRTGATASHPLYGKPTPS